MEIKEYASLAARETTYFWHVGRREILREALLRQGVKLSEQTVLDIGCGTGGNITLLKDFGRVTGLDYFDEALKFATYFPFQELVKGSATSLPFPDSSFTLASALDVLEHIEGDVTAIREVYRVLKPGGVFLVTVPSYQWLWSQHDVALHHIRRYRQSDLVQEFIAAGFEVRQRSHFVMLAVITNLMRKIRDTFFPSSQRAPHIYDVVFPSAINAILLFLLRLEKIWLRVWPLPFGTSILIVAKKSCSSKRWAGVALKNCRRHDTL